MTGRKKVTVVGAGNVGATCALEVARRDYADVVLVDIVPNFAAGKALDMNQMASVTGYEPAVIGTECYSETKGFPPLEQRALEMWEHCITTIENDPLKLDREVDWVMKYKLLERYAAKRGIPMSDPRVAMMDLAYHDVDRKRGLYYMMEARGLADRVVTDEKIAEAVIRPPQTTRARLRGAFIKAAKAKRRDFTVDWVHLKLNDQAQRTVMCKDPFKSHDERVDKLIESL